MLRLLGDVAVPPGDMVLVEVVVPCSDAGDVVVGVDGPFGGGGGAFFGGGRRSSSPTARSGTIATGYGVRGREGNYPSDVTEISLLRLSPPVVVVSYVYTVVLVVVPLCCVSRDKQNSQNKKKTVRGIATNKRASLVGAHFCCDSLVPPLERIMDDKIDTDTPNGVELNTTITPPLKHPRLWSDRVPPSHNTQGPNFRGLVGIDTGGLPALVEEK